LSSHPQPVHHDHHKHPMLRTQKSMPYMSKTVKPKPAKGG
jgi:hypothetical protein